MPSTKIPLPAIGVVAMSFACGPGGGSTSDSIDGEWLLRSVFEESDPGDATAYPIEYEDPYGGCDVIQGQRLIIDGDTAQSVQYYNYANCDDPDDNQMDSYSTEFEIHDVGNGRYEIPNEDGEVTLCIFSEDELDCSVDIEICDGMGNCEPFDTVHFVFERG